MNNVKANQQIDQSDNTNFKTDRPTNQKSEQTKEYVMHAVMEYNF